MTRAEANMENEVISACELIKVCYFLKKLVNLAGKVVQRPWSFIGQNLSGENLALDIQKF